MSNISHRAGGIKARDVEHYIKSMGFERGMMRAVSEIAEQQRALEHTQLEVAKAIDQMTSIISQFVQVADNMKSKAEELDKILGNNRADLPRTALGNGED